MNASYLSFVCALLATGCDDYTGRARMVAAEMQIHSFGVALNHFAEDCGRYPSSTEGLNALVNRPHDIGEARWRGPYLDDRIPNDPWGNDYMYLCPSNRSTNSFDLYSRGRDGLSKSDGNDPDDVNIWRLKRR